MNQYKGLVLLAAFVCNLFNWYEIRMDFQDLIQFITRPTAIRKSVINL